MNKAKERIKELLNRNELEQLPKLIKEYEIEFPYDLELYSLKGTYYFLNGQIEKATKEFLAGYNTNCFNFDLVFNLAIVYEYQGDYFNSLKFFDIAQTLLPSDTLNAENKSELMNLIKDKIDDLLDAVEYYKERESDKAKLTAFCSAEDDYKNHKKNHFNYRAINTYSTFEKAYSCQNLIYDPNYYVANFTRSGRRFQTTIESAQIEIIRKDTTTDIKNNIYPVKSELLLPIILTSDSGFNFFDKLKLQYYDQDIEITQAPQQIYYYRLNKDVTIKNKDYILGQAIELKQNPAKKKLILTVFIDGLTQAILDEYGFENLMPNTANYFKDGIICNNAYTTGDWTYPSMASYFTGLYTTKHKAFPMSVTKALPTDTIVLGEMLNQAAYTAVKIDGCWRTSADMGYTRGFWRQIYSPFIENMSVSDVVTKAIDNIDMLNESNQYLYIRFAELHDIADKYKLSTDLQAKLNPLDRQNEFTAESTSVMITTDKYKEKRYIEQIKYIDKHLGILFNHIEKTIGDDVIVTLFSDHGQGFLLNEDDFFLADKRSKVPLMIKGASKEKTYCNDYISAVDYLHILNKIADLNIDLGEKDGSLPVFFGGEKQKPYIISESIHPDRYYHAALRNENYYFTFKTAEKAHSDGRVSFENYETKLMTPQGEVVENKEMEEYFIKEVFDHMKEFIIY